MQQSNTENNSLATVDHYDRNNLTCMFTENDWKVWEKINKKREEKRRWFPKGMSRTPLYRIIDLRSVTHDDSLYEFECLVCKTRVHADTWRASIYNHLIDNHWDEVMKEWRKQKHEEHTVK